MEIIINFKNYKTGKETLKLARKIQRYVPRAIICVPAIDLREISQKTKLKVFTQHVDINSGTGYVNVDHVRKIGIKGTLINHFENKIDEKWLHFIIGDLHEEGMKTIACASSMKEVKILTKDHPWAIAYEDPDLIGTGKSVTEYDSKSIKEFVKILKGKGIKPLCGAGISSVEDIKEAKKLGCKGVLISSAIAKSKNPEGLLKGLRNVR